jgi:hypothetical protein
LLTVCRVVPLPYMPPTSDDENREQDHPRRDLNPHAHRHTGRGGVGWGRERAESGQALLPLSSQQGEGEGNGECEERGARKREAGRRYPLEWGVQVRRPGASGLGGDYASAAGGLPRATGRARRFFLSSFVLTPRPHPSPPSPLTAELPQPQPQPQPGCDSPRGPPILAKFWLA